MKISTFRLVIAAVSAGLTLPLVAQSTAGNLPYPGNRIVAPINENVVVALPGNVHPMTRVAVDRGAAPGDTPTGSITLVLARSQAQQQALTQYLQELQNPASANFHKWLTPAQYGARFGVSDSDLQTVESWLQSHGFRIEKVAQARNAIQFSGTFAQVHSAFHTTIHTYTVRGQNHLANATDPAIPAALAPVVAAVGPLNDFRPHSNLIPGPRGTWDATHHTIVPQFTFQNDGLSMLYVDPADAATIYDTPNKKLNANFAGTTAYDGTGVIIGVAGDSDITLQDVENYRTGFLGETSATANVPTVIRPGNDPGINGSATEGLLDVEVAGGMAPGAKIDFYTAADTNLTAGLYQAINAAIDDNVVSILNISFGECEADAGGALNAQLNEYFQQAAAQGISVTVSAGDAGSAGCDNFDTEEQAALGLAVNAIASTPFTIAVGGSDFGNLPGTFTSYVTDVSEGTAPYYLTAKSYIPETTWNDSTLTNTVLVDNEFPPKPDPTNIVAGGGGVSSVYIKPWFQTALTPADGGRDLPDVSMLAGNGYYDAAWLVCSDSVDAGDGASFFTDCQNTNGTFASGATFEGVGGTSAAAPAFAGVLALVEQAQGGRLGQADSVLYALAQSQYSAVFHDITVGNNSVYCVEGSLDCLPSPEDCIKGLPDCGPNPYLTESGYDAESGYDLASGLGSVDATNLIRFWKNNALTATNTGLTINSSANPVTAVHGTTLNFGVSVNPSSATGTAVVLGGQDGTFTIPLTSGAGTASYNGLPGGSYTVTARYSGDANDATSTSSPISVDITAEPSTTALTVTGYGFSGPSLTFPVNAIPYGSYVFLNAQITGAAEGSKTEGAATGTVGFFDGATSLGSENIGLNNISSYPALNNNYSSLFAIGKHTITAKYSGDGSYNSSNSAAVTFTVVKAPTTTAVTATPSTVDISTASYVSVSIATPFNLAIAPGGSVALTSGSTKLGTIASFSLNSQPSLTGSYILTGVAQIAGSQLAAGANTITATYSGDAYYAGSSTTFTLTNTSGVGSFSLTNSGAIMVAPGESATSSVTVTPVAGFTGRVDFACSVPKGFTGTCTVPGPVNVSGSAVSVLVSIAVGTGSVPGTYSVTVIGADDTGKTTASTSFNVIVSAPVNTTPGFSLANSGPLTVPEGTSSANTLTLTPANGYTGTANITCTVTTALANPVNPPSCSGAAVTVTGATPVGFTVQIAASSTTSVGTYTVNVTATDASSSSITAGTTFALTVNSPPISISASGGISINPGATNGNSAAITITPADGYIGTVNLGCKLTAQPASATNLPTCSVTNSVVITGSAPATATLTINTSSGTNSAAVPPLKSFFLGGGAALAFVFFFGIPARRRMWRTLFGVLAAVVLISGIGCGGITQPATPPGGPTATSAGTYVFTVTGIDAATQVLTASTTVTVTVK
ncbi:MAG TPA: protease pro-enzyme activation domain-containing protein [Acidobacteriaceae bacterium]